MLRLWKYWYKITNCMTSSSNLLVRSSISGRQEKKINDLEYLGLKAVESDSCKRILSSTSKALRECLWATSFNSINTHTPADGRPNLGTSTHGRLPLELSLKFNLFIINVCVSWGQRTTLGSYFVVPGSSLHDQAHIARSGTHWPILHPPLRLSRGLC